MCVWGGVEKGRTKERYIFEGLFICQRLSTSRFCLNTKFFYQNYFCMRIIIEDILKKFLEVFTRAWRCCYVKNGIIQAGIFKLHIVMRWNF